MLSLRLRQGFDQGLLQVVMLLRVLQQGVEQGGKFGARLVPSKRAGDTQGALPHPHGTSNHAGLAKVERVAGAANTPTHHHHAHFRRSDGMDLWQEAKRWQTGREILLTGAGQHGQPGRSVGLRVGG